MLAKRYRLKNRKEFEKVYKNGQKIKDNFFLLKFQTNNLEITRIGIVVPKKIKITIVKRNKIKRLVSEAVRSIFAKIKKGYDIIIICQKEIYNYWQIQNEIKNLFKKLKIYSDEKNSFEND